ncbi:MAG: hypothetical protein A2381_03270 [Bdellovibrionales bacterium RIFOXYB1_FULL_37_110]|nr:MAG: hypothetical protein A2181_00375 [Bdellovibrionales bacterium RIFOXYA1_FULL_38_20]OFZ48425.1 MAG: hypothetical protein A2417_03760 [Bdellovibrionales bacterium RIFOXYC1_FULL_37_79]OFZ55257.1 MAG: hypothetical protein A2328_11845 [Bdellovibrionales bacterium RIFOXYB2_FULL_36_6]OFZ57946.1 MAG: hypothetical protein A2381_03270 [Bdellovibrionales bacterium RIFOXYB1_FULL_37_110]OFZ63083.1 MAG: hypothetical protein A2577_15400 [Bdellovibrionales bacterium RIFOXYD1_FULL_36_51]OFZ73573.1 MAG: 
MEVGSNIRQFSSQDQFIKQKKLLENAKTASLKEGEAKSEATKDMVKKDLPPDKAEISQTAKDLAKETSKFNGESVGSKASALKGAADVLGKLVPGKIDKAHEIEKHEKLKTDLRPIKKPGVFFIGGFNWLGLSGENKKLEEMSQHIPDSKYFDYQDKDIIISEIKRRPSGQPIILVGRGFGGDVAKEIGSDLDSMEHGFKKIDLLVTIDSSSFAKDIIPQNVVKHINLIDESSLFNDGPNIARDSNRTMVTNTLLKDDILGSRQVQFDLFQNINSVLGDTALQNHLAKESITDMAVNETLRELRN